MSGCEANSCKDLRAESKELLFQKYNEEFNVLSFQDRGGIWIAECSPIENEQVIFKARFDKEPEMLVLDDYEEKYLADLLNEELKKDIEVFFPGAYIHVDPGFHLKDKSSEVRGKSIQELIKDVEMDGKAYGLFVHIYFDKERGSNKLYEEEYYFFENTINEKISKGMMLPITVDITKVDSETIERLEEYYLHNYGKKESYFRNNILKVEDYSLGINSNSSSDLGNPPNISACFKKDYSGYIGGVNEYIRRRELLENE